MGKKYSKEFKNNMVEMYLSGASSLELSEKYGLNRDTVLNWVRLSGKKVRPAGGPSGLSEDGQQKTCCVCGITKPLNDFSPQSNGAGKRSAVCKSCKRDLTRKRRYGLSSEDFENILEEQGRLCAICRKPSDRWHVDHDHKCCPGTKTCGKCVRGVLCPSCNQFLGIIEGKERFLLGAAFYFQKHRGRSLGA